MQVSLPTVPHTDYFGLLKAIVVSTVEFVSSEYVSTCAYGVSASEMTYIVSGGALNCTHSPTRLQRKMTPCTDSAFLRSL